MKRTLLALALLASTPALAEINCKKMADDVVFQDQLLKTQAHDFTTRYDDINIPHAHDSNQVKQDFLRRLEALINSVQRDIDGMRWLIDHHCGPANEEPNAIKSVHDMQSMLIALLVRRMDARALR